MIEVALMLEGQDGLTWDIWQRIARIVEDGGMAGLYRSDHFTNPNPPDKNSLECWVSLAWLSSHTSRIEFGTLVSPISFRDPRQLARQAAAIDDLSGGRLHLGLGAGWNETEHHKFGYDLLDKKPRFARYREGVEVVTRLLRSHEPVTFEGSYYQLHDAVLLPRPKRPGGPRIVIGGNGPQWTLPLAAKYADEWNCVYQTPDNFRALSARLDTLATQHNRPPAAIRRTMMTGVFLIRDEAEATRRLAGRDAEALRQRGALIGSPAEIKDQLAALESAGLQRVMLQWLQMDDFEGIEALVKSLF
jgi:F420-dependent oxidoreductase-like protein